MTTETYNEVFSPEAAAKVKEGLANLQSVGTQ
jgi:hypothetical protein